MYTQHFIISYLEIQILETIARLFSKLPQIFLLQMFQDYNRLSPCYHLPSMLNTFYFILWLNNHVEYWSLLVCSEAYHAPLLSSLRSRTKLNHSQCPANMTILVNHKLLYSEIYINPTTISYFPPIVTEYNLEFHGKIKKQLASSHLFSFLDHQELCAWRGAN